MANTKTETPEQKMARLEEENKALRVDLENETATPSSVTVDFSVGGKGVFSVDMDSKTFSSGSRGFYGNGKLTMGGKRYQVSAMLVEIGSKAGAIAKAA